MNSSQARPSDKLLIDENPLLVLRSLACLLGLNEALVLQQVHYWLKDSKHVHEGHTWIYNSYDQWKKDNFPFWGIMTIKRVFTSLRNKGVLVVGNFNKKAYDKTLWYRIDYDKLDELVEKASYHSGTMAVPLCHYHEVKVVPPIPIVSVVVSDVVSGDSICSNTSLSKKDVMPVVSPSPEYDPFKQVVG